MSADIEDRTAGVFMIRNSALDRAFIGCSSKLRDAKNAYFASLRRGDAANKNLQEDFDLYGESEFEFEVIHYCSKEELVKLKKIYSELYRDLGKLYDGERERAKKVSSALRGKKFDRKAMGWKANWQI